MAAFETARVNFAATFTSRALDITVMQLDRGAEILLRIQVVARASYGTDLYLWWRGGWSADGAISPTWTSHVDPWEACEYWGPVHQGVSRPAKFCGSCGAQRVPEGRFCGSCGAAFADDQGQASVDVRAEVQRAASEPGRSGEILARLIDSYSLPTMAPADRTLLRDKLTSLLSDVTSSRFIDGLSSAPSPGMLTLAGAQDVGGKARRLESIARDLEAAELLLAKAPLTFGYWGPFKSLLKYMDPGMLPVAFGTALGRLAAWAPSVTHVPSDCEDLSPIAELFRIPGRGTVRYMQRRMRRQLSLLAESDPRTYAVVCAAMLAAWDDRVTSDSLLPAYVMLGGTRYLTDDSRRVEMPVDQSVRHEAHPEIWDEHADIAADLLTEVRRSVEALTFAYQICRSNSPGIPKLTDVTVPLALASTDPDLAAHGQAALASTPGCWDSLPYAVWRTFFLSADVQHVNDVATALLSHLRIQSVAQAIHSILSTETQDDTDRLSGMARVYLAYSAPNDSGYRQWPISNEADSRAVAVLSVAPGLDRTPQAWVDVLSPLPREALVQAYVQVVEDERVADGTLDLLAGLINRADGDIELRSLAIVCLAGGGQRATELGWSLLRRTQDRRLSLSMIWNWLKTSQLDAERKARLVVGLLGLADAEQAGELLPDIISAEEWGFDVQQQRRLLSGSPEAARVLWRALGAEDPAEIQRLVLGDPELLRTVGDSVHEADVAAITRNQAHVLLAYVQSQPHRIDEDPRFGARLACAPEPDIQREAIRQLAASGALARYWIVLAESALPLPLIAARTYLEALREKTTATQAVLAAIDSNVGVVRDMGLALLDSRRDVVEADVIWTALLESDDPVVQARVAEETLVRTWPQQELLGDFDRRVLVTRRVNRRAKEQVKQRLSVPSPDLRSAILPERMDALMDMADGTNVRDREWALRRLAVLHLAGVPVDGVRVSTISNGET